jgi:hypothetical protein
VPAPLAVADGPAVAAADLDAAAAAAVLELSTHLQRLQERLFGQRDAPQPRPRDSTWQRAARALESGVRATGVALYLQLRHQGVPAAAAAARLGVPARTLRRWQQCEQAAAGPVWLVSPSPK